MFTGIIEAIGTVESIREEKGNRILRVRSSLSSSLQPDQSLSHNGVCLTVTRVEEGSHEVVAVEETLLKTNLGEMKTGDQINLERGLTLEKRLDGHLVQGHVDTVGHCVSLNRKEGSTRYTFHFPDSFAPLVIEKGAIALNGVSLTIFDVSRDQFSISAIPYTLEHTTLQLLKEGDSVNLEFDLMGKYALRMKEVINP